MANSSMTIAQLEEAAARALRCAIDAVDIAMSSHNSADSRTSWAAVGATNLKLHQGLRAEIKRLEIPGFTSNGIQDRPASAGPSDA